MAKGGDQPAGASGSQFFIVTRNQIDLPPDYALVGKVVSGLRVVENIQTKNSGQDGPPSQPIVMRKVTLSTQ